MSTTAATKTSQLATAIARMYTAEHVAKYKEVMKGEMDAEFTVGPLRTVAAMAEDVDGALCDTACGTGHMLEWLMQNAKGGKNADRKVIANDLAPEMLKATEERLHEHVVSGRVTLSHGSMTQLAAVPDASCAIAINCYAIQHVDADDARATVAEAFRVLTPGGAMLLAWWESVLEGGDECPEKEKEKPTGPDGEEHYFVNDIMYPTEAIREFAVAAGFDDTGASRYEAIPHADFGMTMGLAFLVKPTKA